VSPHDVLVEPSRSGSTRRLLPPASLPAVAPLLLVVGLVLTIAGVVDVGLFYWPLRFGDSEWEFGVIAQTFDALPLPTMGLALVAVGLWARGGKPSWRLAVATIFLVVAALLAALSVVFLLDVPLALNALARGAASARQRGITPNPVVVSGLHRGIAKAAVFAALYVAAYSTTGVWMWRSVRRALRENAGDSPPA